VRLLIVAAGKVREPHLRTAVDDYLHRARRYLPVDEIEVRTDARKGAAAILEAIPDRYEVWVLDAGGEEPTSEALARSIEDRMGHGAKGLAFVIGPAEGLPRKVLARADRRIGLSRLTLPHRLARLVLVEQIYRAMTIIRGEPYSK
jgi:23S rRNA (pseudouridine1915-N3)-methyltransferase